MCQHEGEALQLAEIHSHAKAAAEKSLSFTTHGVRIRIHSNCASALDAAVQYLPHRSRLDTAPNPHRSYCILAGRRTLSLFRGSSHLLTASGPEPILGVLESDLNLYVAAHARGRLFVHAGVVGVGDSAIVIPGRSFTGKSSLVDTLVRAGAIYYSDEYAVFDTHGGVHPFPRTISIRTGERGHRQRVRIAEDRVGTRPIPVGALVFCEYQQGAAWHPAPLDPGTAILRLIDNTIPAQIQPGLTLSVLSRVAATAPAVHGIRGEAREVVAELFGLAR